MRRRGFGLIVVLLCLFVAGCGGDSGGSRTVTSTELMSVVNAALAAFRTADQGTLASYLTADVQLVETNGPSTITTSGRSKVAYALVEYRQNEMQTIYTLEYLFQHHSVSGNVAVMTGQLYIDADWYCFAPGGRCRLQETEDWVLTFRRSNGKWLIAKIERTVSD